MNIITIDCGASFLKAARIHDGVIQEELQKRLPRIENDVIGVFNPRRLPCLLSLIREIIKQLVSACDEKCCGLCISNEMHGFVLAYENGDLFTDYISWQMEFGNMNTDLGIPTQFLSDIRYKNVIEKSGMPLRGGLPVSNLLYFKFIWEEIKERKRLYFYTLGDYIIKYFSKQEPNCHPSNAAATGMYDIKAGKWNEELLDLIGANNIVFPVIGTEIISFKMDGTEFNVLPAIGDQQAALLGAKFDNEDAISFNLGTGGQVSRLVKEPEYLQDGIVQLRPYFKWLYLRTIPHIPSGRAINVYIRFFQDILHAFGYEVQEADVWECILKNINQLEPSSMVCDLSFFENAISNSVQGSVLGIGENSLNFNNLCQSILYSMADNYISMADRICPDRKISRIVFSGGLARKVKPIREYIVEQYSDNIEVCVAENETMMGLYYYWNDVVSDLKNKTNTGGES